MKTIAGEPEPLSTYASSAPSLARNYCIYERLRYFDTAPLAPASRGRRDFPTTSECN